LGGPTEYGAYGVGIIVALLLTGKSLVERSARTTGVDYWLSNRTNEEGSFQRAARLEVSGILNGDEASIMVRVKGKLLQTERSDDSGLPAYVAVIEFSRPEARLVESKIGDCA
jgi:hypothetical protein